MTEIDSHFEYVGMRFAGMLHEFFNSSYFYVIVALASVAYLVYKAVEHESFKPVVLYFFYLFVMWFLVSPVSIDSNTARYHWDTSTEYAFFQENHTSAQSKQIAIPRFLHLINSLFDSTVRAAVREDVQRDITMEIEADRVAGYFNEYRITDEPLKLVVSQYLDYCFKPTLALMHKKQVDPERMKQYLEHPLWIHLDGQLEREAIGGRLGWCKEIQKEIDEGLVALIDRTIRPSVTDAGGKFADEDWNYYRSLLVRKEMIAQFSDMNMARRGLERYGSETYWSHHDSIGRGNAISLLLHGVLTMYTNVKQAISNEMSSRAARYQVIAMAPYFYGFSLMLILCLFPLAGLYSLLPGMWVALVNYGKVLGSVKLWPLFWNILYLFEETTRDTGAILALPFVYIGIPALSFTLVNIASSAASAAVWGLAGGLGIAKGTPVKDAVKVASVIVTKG